MAIEPNITEPIGLICGGTDLPDIVASCAERAGREPVMINITGDYEATADKTYRQVDISWGEFGKLFKFMRSINCSQAAIIGSVAGRPNLSDIRVDITAIRYAPRVLAGYRKGDDGLLRTVETILAENGVELVSPLDIAPDLAAPLGHFAGPKPGSDALDSIDAAAAAARAMGAMDIGQAAIAVGGRVVAVEGAEGTDSLLARIAPLRKAKRIPQSGGVLVKCMKPNQDVRLDIPTIGPNTAAAVREAGLSGVAVEAGRSLMAGREQTIEAFQRANLFLVGLALSET